MKAPRVATADFLNRLTLAILFVFTAALSTGQHNYVSHQGILKQQNGTEMPTGQYSMEVNIYSDGVKVWGPFLMDGVVGQGHAAKVYVAPGGRFNIVIGDVDTALRRLSDALAVPEGADVRVQYIVEGIPQPLSQLVPSAPYAMTAASVAGMKVNQDGRVSVGAQGFDGKFFVNGDIKATDMQVVSGGLFVTNQLNAQSMSPKAVSTKNLIVGGKIQHFKIQGAPYPEGGVDIDKSLNVNASKFFCGLTRIDTNSYTLGFNDDYGTAHCRLYIDQSNVWHLAYQHGGGMTSQVCRAMCFQYQN